MLPGTSREGRNLWLPEEPTSPQHPSARPHVLAAAVPSLCLAKPSYNTERRRHKPVDTGMRTDSCPVTFRETPENSGDPSAPGHTYDRNPTNSAATCCRAADVQRRRRGAPTRSRSDGPSPGEGLTYQAIHIRITPERRMLYRRPDQKLANSSNRCQVRGGVVDRRKPRNQLLGIELLSTL